MKKMINSMKFKNGDLIFRSKTNQFMVFNGKKFNPVDNDKIKYLKYSAQLINEINEMPISEYFEDSND